MVVHHLKQIGKVKKISGCLLSWQKIKKNHRFEVSSSLILCNDNKPLIKQIVICDKNWILYDNWQWPAQQLDQGIAPKHFPKSNLHQKNVMITDWQSTAHLIHYSFLNTKETTYTYEVCSANLWHAPKPAMLTGSINRNDPILLHDNARPHITQQCFKSWMNWAMRFFSHPPHSPDLLPRDYYFFQYLNNFVQGKCFHNQQEAENAFQEIVESWSMDFLCYRNKQTLFLVGKTALILMVPILINKNMFEPCYNDLKFTVWNY